MGQSYGTCDKTMWQNYVTCDIDKWQRCVTCEKYVTCDKDMWQRYVTCEKYVTCDKDMWQRYVTCENDDKYETNICDMWQSDVTKICDKDRLPFLKSFLAKNFKNVLSCWVSMETRSAFFNLQKFWKKSGNLNIPKTLMLMIH